MFISGFFIIKTGSYAQTAPGRSSAFDSTKAIKEIDQRNGIYLAALKQGDSVALGDFYTTDARILNSGMPSTTGRQAIVRFYGWMIRGGINSCQIVTGAVWGSSNDLVVEEGIIEFRNASGQAQVKGRHLLVWKQENGI